MSETESITSRKYKLFAVLSEYKNFMNEMGLAKTLGKLHVRQSSS